MSGKGLEIKIASCDNAQAIAAVLDVAFTEYQNFYTPEGYSATVPGTEEIKSRFGKGEIWVAVFNGEIVGTVSVLPKGEALYIRSMAVAPEMRGQNTGEQLLREAENYAYRNRFQKLTLSTTPFLHRAIKLYENFGFEKNDDAPHDLFGTPIFTMAKNLNVPSNAPDK